MPLNVGSRLGHYDVTALIGEGGMGQVWQATDTKLKRQVALKILPEAFAADPERLARFQREAEVLASLNHPNIAAIHGLEEADGVRALVLELVEGPTLADRIKQGPIPLDEALPIAKQIAEALEAAHEAGVVHRDLKPANVKVKDDGTVKVLDFGLAKALDPSPTGDPSQSPTLTAAATQMGMIMGTAAYMSPEQASGQTADKRSDIWSFGVVLYEMLTGRSIFVGETVSHVLGAVLQIEPKWEALRSDTPTAVVRLLHRCLQKDRKKRLPDIGVARLELDEALAVQPSGDVSPVVASATTIGRPSLVWMAAVAVVAAVVGGGTMWNLRPSPAAGSPVRSVISASPSAVPGPPSLQTELAVSPDGTMVVYGTLVDGESRAYLRRVDRLEGEPLGDVQQASTFFFSPDGQWVGFATSVDRTLKKIQVTGGAAITLCPMPRSPRGATWEPDDTIIFSRFEPGTGLFRVSAAGGEPEALTMAEAPERHYWPEFLPSGRAVLFTIGATSDVSSEDSQIAVLDLDSMEQRVLIEGGTHPRLVSDYLVYSFSDTLRAVRFDTDRLEVLGDPIPVLEGLTGRTSGGVNLDVSDDGALVYQTGGLGSNARTLVWVDRQGNEEAVPAEARSYDALQLFPDGRSVLTHVQDGDNSDVMIYDLERDTPTRFTFASGLDQWAIISPDGERVVFSSSRDGGLNLYWKAADGTGEVHRLTTSTNLQAVSSFSPDGRSVLVNEATTDGVLDIGVLAMDGDGSVEWLLQEPFYEAYAEISPDGRWLAYTSNESGQFEIYVRPFPNVHDGKRQISRDFGFYPMWGPDGRELFYQTNAGPGAEILTVMAVPIETEPSLTVGNPVPLFEGPYRRIEVNTFRPYDISSDGQRFLMLKEVANVDERDEGTIILVQNWIEELTNLFPDSR